MDNGNENTVREMIRNENDMMNHRITWLILVQGLLFTAIGAALDKKDFASLLLVVSMLGVVVAGISYIGLFCTHKAICRLHDLYPNITNRPGVVGYWSTSPIIRYLPPWQLLPVVFAAGWIILLALLH